MSVGLDIGASRIRCVRRRGEQLIGRNARAQFTALPDAPNYRSLLEAGRIPFAVCDNALTILGDNAAAYASLFHVRPQTLMPQGRLPMNDPVARQSLAALVEALLGEPDQPGEICGVSLPGGEVFQSSVINHELEYLSRLIRLRGFTPMVLSAGMAVILSAGVRDSFTAIGLSFGAATSELVLVHRGVQRAIFSIPRGGNWMDERIAEHFDLTQCTESGEHFFDLPQAASFRQSFVGNLLQPGTDEERFLADLHFYLTDSLIRGAANELGCNLPVLKIPQPLPVIAIGGVARIRGFEELLRHCFLAARFPLTIREFRLATSDDYAVARGCLINAELGAETQSHAA